MQNISLFIGNNASGKTRYLKKIIKQAMEDKQEIVTNIEGCKLVAYAYDKQKKEKVKEVSNPLVDKILIQEDIDNLYYAYVANLLQFMYAKGNI